jgi:cupin 2 domain-containing protein
MLRVEKFFDVEFKTAGQERFTTLFENRAVKVERIVSESYDGREDVWYDQSEPEWVIVLRGEAELELDDGTIVHLKAGDYLEIPAHTKHRVRRTSKQTFWLAVHVKETPRL